MGITSDDNQLIGIFFSFKVVVYCAIVVEVLLVNCIFCCLDIMMNIVVVIDSFNSSLPH